MLSYLSKSFSYCHSFGGEDMLAIHMPTTSMHMEHIKHIEDMGVGQERGHLLRDKRVAQKSNHLYIDKIEATQHKEKL